MSARGRRSRQQDENEPITPMGLDLLRGTSNTMTIDRVSPKRISSVSACERCRETGIKCVRRQGQTSCTGCHRENTECISSPTRRRVREIRQPARPALDVVPTQSIVDSRVQTTSQVLLGPSNRNQRPDYNSLPFFTLPVNNAELFDPSLPYDLPSTPLQGSEEAVASLLTTPPRYPDTSASISYNRHRADSTSLTGSPSRRRKAYASNNSSPVRSGMIPMESEGLMLPSLFIKVDQVIHEAVERGGFASVHVGISNGSKVAIKAVRVTQQTERVVKRRLGREILVWRGLNHPNIVPLLGIDYCPNLSQLEVMVTPWYDNGSAAAYLSSGIRDLRERLHLSLGVAKGIHYLHKLNPVVIHGDLKPSNVLIEQSGEPRICDFGLARVINGAARSGLTTTTRHASTPLYAAPEILLADDDAPPFEPSTASDVYSLGSLIYEFLTGRMPYANLSNNLQVLCAIIKGTKPATRPTTVAPLEDLQWDLFESCWMEPTERPNALSVVSSLVQLRDKGCTRR